MSAPSPKVLTRARTTSSFSSSPLPSSSQYSNHSLGARAMTAVEAAHDVPSFGKCFVTYSMSPPRLTSSFFST